MERVNPLAQGHIVVDVYARQQKREHPQPFSRPFHTDKCRRSPFPRSECSAFCDCASGLVMPKKRSSTKTTNSIGVWSSFSSTTSQRWRFINVSTPCPQFDSKEMTMTPTEWLILTITTFVVVIAAGVWFYQLTH